MSVPTFKIGSLELGAGPGAFTPQWPPRRKKYEGPGWSTIQDFGQPIDDLVLEIGSGGSGQLTTAEVQALTALSRVEGAVYAYEDAFGTVGTVVILNFTPTFYVAGLWNYSLTLAIRTATFVYGVAEV